MIRLAVLAPLLITGCSLGLGSDEFSCGAPDGVRCMSARSVYEASRNGTLVNGRGHEEKVESIGYDPRDRWPQSPWTNAPTVDAPQPVRKPPNIMRAYIFPFEDSKGDLHMPGLVFTEIERRRWNITDYALSHEDNVTGNARPREGSGGARSTGAATP